jgi:hypothetical protein
MDMQPLQLRGAAHDFVKPQKRVGQLGLARPAGHFAAQECDVGAKVAACVRLAFKMTEAVWHVTQHFTDARAEVAGCLLR